MAPAGLLDSFLDAGHEFEASTFYHYNLESFPASPSSYIRHSSFLTSSSSDLGLKHAFLAR